jgi:PAS domain-containing protein
MTFKRSPITKIFALFFLPTSLLVGTFLYTIYQEQAQIEILTVKNSDVYRNESSKLASNPTLNTKSPLVPEIGMDRDLDRVIATRVGNLGNHLLGLYVILLGAIAIGSFLAAKGYLQRQQTTQKYQDLYNQAPCGYHSLNLDGMFIKINNTELKILGYQREQLLYKRYFTELLTPDSLEAYQACLPMFQETGEFKHSRLYVKTGQFCRSSSRP